MFMSAAYELQADALSAAKANDATRPVFMAILSPLQMTAAAWPEGDRMHAEAEPIFRKPGESTNQDIGRIRNTASRRMSSRRSVAKTPGRSNFSFSSDRCQLPLRHRVTS